jgi:hypothetical protein
MTVVSMAVRTAFSKAAKLVARMVVLKVESSAVVRVDLKGKYSVVHLVVL